MIKLSGLAFLMFSTLSFGAANYCASDSLAENLSLLRNVASSSAANLEASDKSTFCSNRQDKSKLADFMRQRSNLLSNANEGGLFGLQTGVCWWHSRLQRRMSYLADFRPDLPKPSEKEVKKILRKIKRGKKVVTIPGYANLAEFSNEHASLIQKSLNAWIFGDSFLRQQWVNGLKGKSNISPEKMKDHLEKMYGDFQEAGGPVVQMLQMPGVMAHAWILNDMKKVSETEYQVEVIDSNAPNITSKYSVFTNRTNMLPVSNVKDTSKGIDNNSFPLFDYYDSFVAYTKYDGELKKLQKAVTNFCNDMSTPDENEENEENQE